MCFKKKLLRIYFIMAVVYTHDVVGLWVYYNMPPTCCGNSSKAVFVGICEFILTITTWRFLGIIRASQGIV